MAPRSAAIRRPGWSLHPPLCSSPGLFKVPPERDWSLVRRPLICLLSWVEQDGEGRVATRRGKEHLPEGKERGGGTTFLYCRGDGQGFSKQPPFTVGGWAASNPPSEVPSKGLTPNQVWLRMKLLV